MLRRERDAHDCESDEQRVSEVQTRHRSVLVTKLVLCPYAALALGAVHGVDEAVGARLRADCAGHGGVGEEARGHTWPEGEYNKRNQVTRSHGPAPRGVEFRAGGRNVVVLGAGVCGQVNAVLCRGVEEEPDEEEDCAGDVDEGVDAVCPVHEKGVLEEPALDVEFEEDVQALLEGDDLQGVAAGDGHGAFDHSHGAEGATELVDLGRGCEYGISTVSRV